jgi:hypothetical protein
VYAVAPSTLAIYKALTLYTIPLEPEFVTIAAADAVSARTAVLPVIVATFTMFGAAIIHPPKTIDMAIDLPVDEGVNPIFDTADPEASFSAVTAPALILTVVTELLANSVALIEPLAILRLAGVWTISQDVPLKVQALPFDSK